LFAKDSREVLPVSYVGWKGRFVRDYSNVTGRLGLGSRN